jgi:hypothetical protein
MDVIKVADPPDFATLGALFVLLVPGELFELLHAARTRLPQTAAANITLPADRRLTPLIGEANRRAPPIWCWPVDPVMYLSHVIVHSYGPGRVPGDSVLEEVVRLC